MSVLSESNRLHDVLKYEAGVEKLYSREQVVVEGGEALAVGTVLGRVGRTCPTTGTPVGTPTGGGTCTGVSAGPEAQIGTYTLRCIVLASGAGTFEVQAPDGTALEQATVGVAYTNPQINFTLNDGTPDFALGDSFTIAVAAGSGKVKAIDFSAVDGSEDACGILAASVDTTGTQKTLAFTSGGPYEVRRGDVITGATSGATASVVSLALSSGTWAGGDAAGTMILDNQVGTFQSENLDVGTDTNVATIASNSSAYAPDTDGAAIVRDAIIDAENLVWPTGATTEQKAKALAQLKDKGIIVRLSI
jgi:hypothetical protein